MLNLYEILQKVLLTESAVDVNKVGDAIDKKYQVKINYRSNDEDVANGARTIEVYAYGLTKAGNPVIRAFQPYGDTTSSTPNWKFFRLDRITNWETTNQFFHRPASDFYNVGKFNPTGDKSMSVVYKIATFDGESEKDKEIAKNIDNGSGEVQKVERGAKKKETAKQNSGEVFKTDTERGMEKLRKELDNPVYQYTVGGPRKKAQSTPVNVDDSKPEPQQNSFDTSEKPKTVNTTSQNVDNQSNKEEENPIFKTDTEKALERQRELMNNKKFVSPDVLDNWNKEQERRKNK
jgi:hypothetical protein